MPGLGLAVFTDTDYSEVDMVESVCGVGGNILDMLFTLFESCWEKRNHRLAGWELVLTANEGMVIIFST